MQNETINLSAAIEISASVDASNLASGSTANSRHKRKLPKADFLITTKTALRQEEQWKRRCAALALGFGFGSPAAVGKAISGSGLGAVAIVRQAKRMVRYRNADLSAKPSRSREQCELVLATGVKMLNASARLSNGAARG